MKYIKIKGKFEMVIKNILNKWQYPTTIMNKENFVMTRRLFQYNSLGKYQIQIREKEQF